MNDVKATRHTPVSRLNEYFVLKMLIQRCHNPNNKLFGRYAGEGATVCERWRGLDGFDLFLADVGYQPQPGYGLRRLNESLGFQPGNVEWAPTRPCRLIEYQGKKQSVAAWARALNQDPAVVRSRLFHGWTPSEALTSPVRRRKSRRAAAGENDS